MSAGYCSLRESLQFSQLSVRREGKQDDERTFIADPDEHRYAYPQCEIERRVNSEETVPQNHCVFQSQFPCEE